MPNRGNRSWKNERASVDRKGTSKPRSNKYSGSESKARPPRGSRTRVWVGGYKRQDGTEVSGYYRGTGRKM